MRAAERLHITPGAVSHQIRNLEAQLCTELVRKSGREIELTGTGRQLALGIADLFDRLEAEVAKATDAGKRRPIRVKVIPSFAIKWLMPRLAGFYALHGAVDVEIATVARTDDVGLENADFVVRRGDGNWPDVRADLLFSDALVLACAPAMASRLRTPADVLKEKLLASMIAPTFWEVWLQSAGLAAGPSTRFVPLANAALCLQAAAQGLGVAVTQEAYLAHDFASGTLVNPIPHAARGKDGYYLVWDPANDATYPFREFADWILAAA
jgi:LysR family glycine cleavage system transcriptional activator/LysR family transcriptional regulator of beta-lactamase